MTQAATGTGTTGATDLRYGASPLPPKRVRDFWLSWLVVSALGSGIGFACGFVGALISSMFMFAAAESALLRDEVIPVFVVVGSLAAALAGLVIGAMVGFGQSFALPWPTDARRQWRRWSLLSWAVGAGVGLPLAMTILLGGSDALGLNADRHNLPIVELTAAILGLVVGFGTHRVLPRPAPSSGWWVAGTVVATTLGWALARPFDSGFQEIGLSWTGLVLGSLVYGMVSGGLMVWAERVRRQAVGTQA